jgi:hypothetical protein
MLLWIGSSSLLALLWVAGTLVRSKIRQATEAKIKKQRLYDLKRWSDASDSREFFNRR